MSFDSLGRYVPNHKTSDHVGNIVPTVEHSEGVRPHGEFKVAAWLPVQFYDKYFEDYYVVLPGKLLAADNDGRLVPAQYGLAGATITYTSDDVTAGVIDVRTGSALLSNATGQFAVSGVTDFMGQGVTLAVSKPLGVAPYAFWQWAGDGSSNDDGNNPAGLRHHNYNMQHRVALLCDYVIELPLVPLVVSSENLANASYSNNVLTFTALANLPVAANTVRTAITFADNALSDSETRFVNQVDAVADLDALGDWTIDLTTGVVKAYAASDPGGGSTAYSVTYYSYNVTGTATSPWAQVQGDLKAGDFLKCDQDSNFVVATSEDFKDIMGQVLEVEDVLDKDYLGRVRTAYDSLGSSASYASPGYAGQMDQMPGSANGGVPDKVHYAGAASKVVRINLVSR